MEFVLSMKDIARLVNEQGIGIAETTVNKYADVYKEFLPKRRLDGERWDKFPRMAVDVIKCVYMLSQPKQGKGKKRHEIKTILMKEFGDQLRKFPIEGEFENITHESEAHTHTHIPPSSDGNQDHTSPTPNLPIPQDALQLVESYMFVAESALQSIAFYRELVSEKKKHIEELESHLEHAKADKAKLEERFKSQLLHVLGDVQRWKKQHKQPQMATKTMLTNKS